MSSQIPFRQFDIGTKVYNAGTASFNQVPGGVFPGMGAMGVTAPGGMFAGVNAGYCCVPNTTSSLQGGYIFGLMTSTTFQVTAADPVNPRIDIICATVNDLGTSASTSLVQIITGTAASTPSPPTPPANSIILAQLAVGAAVTSITAANITDERAYVVAPGGILPIRNAAAAPAVPASQFMFDMSSGQLCQGTGTAGVVATPGGLQWTPQIAVRTSNILAASAGALTTVQSVSVTTDGATDIEMYIKWDGVKGNAGYITMSVTIDGATADSLAVQSTASTTFPTSGGSARFFTSASQGNTPSAATHSIAWKFQAAGGGTSTSDGIIATTSAPAILRVVPVTI